VVGIWTVIGQTWIKVVEGQSNDFSEILNLKRWFTCNFELKVLILLGFELKAMTFCKLNLRWQFLDNFNHNATICQDFNKNVITF